MKSRHTSTNLRLPEELLQAVKLRAVQERRSMADLIRECLYQKFSYSPSSPSHSQEQDPIFQIIGIGSSGIRDGSVNHDSYLYGAPTKKTAKR